MFVLGSRSLRRLEGVHPDMVDVVKKAISVSRVDFTVLEGMRSLKRQRELYATGKSMTMNSRHLTGHAVDIAPWINGSVSWDWKDYYPMADAMKLAASDLGVDLEWGGDWKTFPDGPHFQLAWTSYPAK